MFNEIDSPPHFLIQNLKSGKYSQTELQNIFPEISDFGFLNLDSENQFIRIINYEELEVMRTKRLCIACENRWYKGHECENPCEVVFNHYDREYESDDDTKLDGKAEEFGTEMEGQEQKVEDNETVLNGVEDLIDQRYSYRETAESFKEVVSVNDRSSDQMLEEKSEKIVEQGCSNFKGLKVFNDKQERELDKDFFSSGKNLETDFIEEFKQREVKLITAGEELKEQGVVGDFSRSTNCEVFNEKSEYDLEQEIEEKIPHSIVKFPVGEERPEDYFNGVEESEKTQMNKVVREREDFQTLNTLYGLNDPKGVYRVWDDIKTTFEKPKNESYPIKLLALLKLSDVAGLEKLSPVEYNVEYYATENKNDCIDFNRRKVNIYEGVVEIIPGCFKNVFGKNIICLGGKKCRYEISRFQFDPGGR